MTSEDSAWVENRIRWQAGKHGLPSGRTRLFDDAEAAMQRSVHQHLDESRGRPVLLALDSPERWTVITTRQFIGVEDGRVHACELAEVESVDSRDFPADPREVKELALVDPVRLKSSWEYLRVTSADGSTLDFWVPAGPEAYAVWNILLTAVRVARQSRSTW